MRLSLDIKDDKAAFFLELLKNLPFVKINSGQPQPGNISATRKKKVKQNSSQKATLLAEIEEAVEELKLVLEGKKQARNAEDFLNEL